MSGSEVETQDRKDGIDSGKSSDAALSSSEKEVLARSPSLKRKRTRDDEYEDSSNLELIYPPKKRSRTPSSDNNPQETLEPGSPSGDSDSPATPPPDRVASERPSTPPNVVFGSSATISSPLPKSLQPRLVTSNAFSAFVGTSPSFSTASPNPSNLKPAWSEPNLAKNLDEESECSTEGSVPSHVLVAASTTSKVTEVEHLTGEESEDVEHEIRGVKLFVKRGDKPFSDGMPGHLKLLSDRTTLDERLCEYSIVFLYRLRTNVRNVVFRREPLWQVSLNIRLHPSVRCTFDASENVLRIIVTEPVESKDEREIVIYAFKPGKSCSKQDFKEFAEAFLMSPGLKAKTES
ncbi:hypothetical protein C0995_014693 [Termitomyces sp. Mi166|nr:hypothetical protein C0995_014693 [Termitomyces sp. Mi166\